MEDFLQLNDSSKDSVIDGISARLLNNQYAKIGSQVLVATQSNSEKAGIYHTEYVEAYKESLDKWKNDAHPCQLVNSSYFRLRRLAKDQTIAYFGNGGALRDDMISHLGSIIGGKRDKKYCKKVVTSLKIHELFTGCLINDQQIPRCGIIAQAQINERGHLNGFRLTSTLLESRRVVSKGSNQRNFNIFYALLHASSEIKQSLHLGEPSQYTYLSEYDTKSNPLDVGNFTILDDGLSTLNLSAKSKLQVYSILAGILHLGNIQFINDKKNNQPCKISNTEVRDIVALLCSVDPSALEASLTIKTTIINGEYVTQILNSQEAKDQADTLASQLYTMVYSWFIEHVNKRIAATEYANSILFVDLKPIYVEKENELVDFLSNATYQHFYESCIKQLLEPSTHFRAEGLPKNEIKYKFTNTDALLFDKNAILNQINKSQEYALMLQNIRKEFQGSDFLSSSRSVTNFGIEHYNGTVFYECKSFIQQNKEFLSNDLVTLMAGSAEYPQSSNQLLAKIFTSKSIRNLATKQCNILVPVKNNKSHFKCNHYLQAYTKLVEIVKSTMINIVYVVPFKNTKISGSFLKHHRIYDLYKELADFKGDYVVGMPFSDFIDKYGSVLNVTAAPPGQMIEQYKTANNLQNSDLYLGQRQVMVSNNVFVQLESKLKIQLRLLQATGNAEDIVDNTNSLPDDDTASVASGVSETLSMSESQAESFVDDASIADTIVALDQPIKESIEEAMLTTTRKRWLCCVYSLTWFIPDCCLRICGKMKRGDVQLAWREKVAICCIIMLLSSIVIFFIVGLGPLICPLQNIYSPFELQGNNNVLSAYGKVYSLDDIHGMNYVHAQNKQGMDVSYGGKDISSALVQFRPANLYCNVPSSSLVFLQPPPKYTDTNATKFTVYHSRWQTNPALGSAFINNFISKQRHVKELAWAPSYIATLLTGNQPRKLVIINQQVFDLTFWSYKSTDPNYKWFSDNVIQLLEKSYGTDLTSNTNFMQLWNKNDGNIKKCFNNLFYVGVVDNRLSFTCVFSNVLLFGTSVLLVLIIGIKFLAALRSALTSNPESLEIYTIIQIPCYSEDEESLKRTLDSVAASRYSDVHKLMFIICDGMVMGSGNDRNTPQIVMDLLNITKEQQEQVQQLSFLSIGEGLKQHNMGKVFSGLYDIKGHLVPYILVVKVGRPTERIKPGNRGKRDSQMVLMRFLNKVCYDSPMSPLELEMFHHIKNVIGVEPSLYELILMVDADTEIMKDSLTPLVARMQHDTSVMGCCGETRILNENQSWATMIQVYEYYISHHLSKAFESMFGSVTCLPGCFCMYRIKHPSKKTPLLVNNQIIEDYGHNDVDTLHKKNLLSLGEDRYLTTLMLKFFPYNKMVFVSNSVCLTNAPDKWAVLKSQRRRWINSTVHNLAELLWIDSLCGFCCFSMRFIVMLDLFSTIVGPVGVLYLGYLIGRIIYGLVVGLNEQFPLISFLLLAAIYGLQALIFIFKRDFQHIGWMLIYILAIPVFNLALPLYSFWHMDDFSWGSTRVILGEGGKKQIISKEKEKFDANQIPHKKWSDYEIEVNELLLQRPTALGGSQAGSQVGTPQQRTPLSGNAGREASWFVDSSNSPQTGDLSNNRLSNMYTIDRAMDSKNKSILIGDQLRASQTYTHVDRTSAVMKRSPFVNTEQFLGNQKAPSNEELSKSIEIIMKQNDYNMTKKQVFVMLQKEYQSDFDREKIYDMIDAVQDRRALK